MKVGFLSSHRGQQKYIKEHKAVVNFFEKKKIEVVHSLDTSIESLLSLGWLEREAIFMNFYHKLETCDIVFAECTMQSTQVGFGLSYLRAKGMPIVMMTIRNADEYSPKKDVYSNIENLMFLQYDMSDITTALEEAVEFMEQRIDKRFTVIFPSHLLAKIEEQVKKKKLPKSVYIRQLIEKDLAASEEK